MTIQIRYSEANDGQWGADTTDEAAARVAQNVTDLARSYVARNWPEHEVDAFVCPEALLSPVDALCNESEESEADEIILLVKEYIGRHWCEEALWEPGFDADAYLAKHPR